MGENGKTSVQVQAMVETRQLPHRQATNRQMGDHWRTPAGVCLFLVCSFLDDSYAIVSLHS
ncbi:hypothetical protein LI328DRAFT_132349 [Trichoderma asperelloides]|nr:hypothetical protein LI328DRAFT_132349 [Trichoderma asperelloides]